MRDEDYDRAKLLKKEVSSLRKCVNEAVCLGDPFNSSGSNKDLIEDRVKKGQACIISATSLCSEITMGVHEVQTLLLLYKSLFLQVLLYNSQAWCNLTKKELTLLATIQLKFLKRIFHAPSSTSNPVILLETGVLPIKHEINKRQLNYLHHILTQEDNDPIKMVYNEELKYEDEPNWANEMKETRLKYEIHENDDEIATFSKEKWKSYIKTKVLCSGLEELNNEAETQKQGCKLGRYDKLAKQEYLINLKPQQARKLFHVRAGILDVKTVRKYWYKDDQTCRLCELCDEDVDHVVNRCKEIPRDVIVENVLTDNLEEMKIVADRCILFASKVKELEEASDCELVHQ